MLFFLQPGHEARGPSAGHERSPAPTLARRFGPLALLGLLGVLFFADLVVHPDQVLYSDYSDLLPLHLPSKRFLVHSWRATGEVPCWCPYNFAGMPFVQDIQVSAFYPPHWPLFLLPEEWLGAALSWLVVGHVVAAGWCMFAYARVHGLGGTAAVVAAAGYMFAGKWLLHLLGGGHYNMVPLAWLPLVLLWLERLDFLRATWAGAVFALFVLGAYPYITLYAGLFVALWTLGPALERAGYLGGQGARSWRRTGAALARWLGLGAWTLTVAAGLGAVQLLPGLEMAHEASRSSGVSAPGQVLAGGVRSLAALVGPALTDDGNWLWEDRAGLGLLWLVAVLLAPLLCKTARVRFEVAACLVWVLFALAGVALVQGLPGFRLFQLPSRMLLIAALPVALLAGRTTQALFGGTGLDPVVRARCLRILLKTCAVVVVLVAALAVALKVRGETLLVAAYWPALLVTIPCAACLLAGRPRLTPRSAGFAWLVVLLVDLWALGRPLVEVRSETEVYAETACTRYLAEHRDEHGRVLEINPAGRSANSTPLWPGLPAVLRVEPVRGFNPLDVLRYKEYLQFIAGRDEALRPIDRMYTSAVLGTFPIENEALADLLGVRYLLLPADMPLEAVVRGEGAAKAWQVVAEDPAATTFAFIPERASGEAPGLRPLGAYRVYENTRALPRAFVVQDALPLPEDRSRILPTLQATEFRRTVLLEGELSSERAGQAGEVAAEAELLVYEPNQVTVSVRSTAAGYLVLTDPWYPGWTCTVDGRPVAVQRADYLFRSVEVPAGKHLVVFRFEPAAYRWGKTISLGALVCVFGVTLVGLARVRRLGGSAHV